MSRASPPLPFFSFFPFSLFAGFPFSEICSIRVIFQPRAAHARTSAALTHTHAHLRALALRARSFFTTKYGLRSLVLEWVGMTNRAMAAHRHADADVGAVAAMLAHEVDEAYWPMHVAAKEVVHDLLKAYLRGKAPHLTEARLLEALGARVAGRTELAEDEWGDVLRYMHSHGEALTLTHALREQARARRRAAPEPPGNGGEGGAAATGVTVTYAQLLHAICAFQLGQHRRFLAPFGSAFRALDADRDGSLSAPQLVALARTLGGGALSGGGDNGGEGGAGAFLARADPRGVGSFTFSQAVAALAAEIVAT